MNSGHLCRQVWMRPAQLDSYERRHPYRARIGRPDRADLRRSPGGRHPVAPAGTQPAPADRPRPTTPQTADALVWLGGESFERQTIAVPTLGVGESLIRLTTATVCGSDRHTVAGHRPGAYPSVLGHEASAASPPLRPVSRSVTASSSPSPRCAGPASTAGAG